MKVPLLLRPPNPPAVFVGRSGERAALTASIARASVSVLWGFGGLGKSALAAQVLADDYAKERDRTVVADVAGADDGPVPVALRALAEVTGADFDWASVADSPALAARAVVETLEEHGLWLLLENVEHAGDDALAATLALALRHARDAKVLLISREDPRVRELVGQTLALGPMDDDDLRLLLDAHAPGLTEAEAGALLVRAQGSPWRLIQLTVGDVSNPGGPERSLAQLAPAAQGLLRTLSLVGATLPRDVVGRASRLPADKALDALVRRGFLDVTPAGLRLHDAARPFVEASLDDEERALREERLLTALADADTPGAIRAAVALALRRGEVEAALATLDAHGERLLQDGNGSALFEELLRADDERLGVWLCRAAVDAGGAALARTPEPSGTQAAARLWWAQVRFHAGDPAGALQAADAARADEGARSDDATSFQAGLLAGRCLLNVGEPAKARDTLGALAPASLDDKVQRDVLLAGALASLGESAEAAALVARTRGRLDDVADSARRRAQAHLARTLYELGDLQGGLALVRPLAERATAAVTATGRRALLSLAGMSVDAGLLADARATLDRAGATGAGGLFDAGLLAVELHLRLASGELEGLDAALVDLEALAREHAWATLEQTARQLIAELDTLRGRVPRATAAAVALARGDVDDALGEARAAQARARERGRVLAQLDATLDAADALVVIGDREALAREADRLATAAAALPSERYALAARFFALVAQGALEAGALAGFARASERSPLIARRAQHLLGEDAALDDVDRRVLDALRQAPAGVSETVGSGEGPQWVVDLGGARVVLPDGAPVDLAKRRVLLDLLAVLCRHDGAASKEQLLTEVWQIDDYHPLRHDNRLKVAVRKLRRLLEEPLGGPPVESVEDGYRLRGRVRFVDE
jgi:hypothetical protein